jgi:phage FluMu gp28-like protein
MPDEKPPPLNERTKLMNLANLFQKIGLLPYQSAFAANDARFKIGLWARQTGKDHTAAAEAVLDCLHHRATTWIILAASERQALESLAKAKEWAQIFKLQIDEYTESPALGSAGLWPAEAGVPPASTHKPTNLSPASPSPRFSGAAIKWSNGSRLIALPANPSTIRGYSANLILTEFAFHENADAIWRAIYPAISNPLRGGVKKLRIISTPNGLNNKFAHLWSSWGSAPVTGAVFGVPPNTSLTCTSRGDEAQICPASPSSISGSGIQGAPLRAAPAASSALYFKSKITIHDAIAAGLPLDTAELQAGLNDPEAWAQEYLCEFADNSTVLLPYDLIESCESTVASELSTPQSLSASALPGNTSGPRPQLFAGIDFARKNHLTVCWILERLPSSAITGGLRSTAAHFHSSSMPGEKCSIASVHSTHVCLTREVLILRNLSTPEQLEILRPRLKLCHKACLDFTGPGVGLGDFLHREFGGHRIELCPFTSAFKADLFPRLAAAFESRQLLIPIARDIREDLHSIYRITTNSGNILYRAHSTPDGHADRATALALAVRAVQTTPVSQCATTVNPKNYRGRTNRRISSRNHRAPYERTLAIIY